MCRKSNGLQDESGLGRRVAGGPDVFRDAAALGERRAPTLGASSFPEAFPRAKKTCRTNDVSSHFTPLRWSWSYLCSNKKIIFWWSGYSVNLSYHIASHHTLVKCWKGLCVLNFLFIRRVTGRKDFNNFYYAQPTYTYSFDA